jgi:predicted YcjX-like family ATPase
VFPGDLPEDPASVRALAEAGESGEAASATAALHFPRFAPPRISLDSAAGDAAALPHIRLDRAIDFLLGDQLA